MAERRRMASHAVPTPDACGDLESSDADTSLVGFVASQTQTDRVPEPPSGDDSSDDTASALLPPRPDGSIFHETGSGASPPPSVGAVAPILPLPRRADYAAQTHGPVA